MREAWLIVAVLGACAVAPRTDSVRWVHPAGSRPSCSEIPTTGPATGFRHHLNHVTAQLGEPRHRGTDVIVSVDAPRQLIEGDLAYDALDQAAKDEDVELFTCTAAGWAKLGEARTDGSGHFALALTGATRLPLGLHDLYASVRADRTGIGFLGYVAPVGAPVVVTDVDGTLTSSENAVIASVVFERDIDAQQGAPVALRELAQAGYQPVYLTARGRGLTELTRSWLASHEFPRGPIITAHGFTPPGDAALAHKTHALAQLRASGVIAAFGIGNRASDVTAYTRAGIPADHMFMLATGYADELRPLTEDASRAVAFHSYAELPALIAQHTHGARR